MLLLYLDDDNQLKICGLSSILEPREEKMPTTIAASRAPMRTAPRMDKPVHNGVQRQHSFLFLQKRKKNDNHFLIDSHHFLTCDIFVVFYICHMVLTAQCSLFC